MSKLRWRVIAIIGCAVTTNIFFIGCSEESPATSSASSGSSGTASSSSGSSASDGATDAGSFDASDDVTGDGAVDANVVSNCGAIDGGPACVCLGATCTSASQCCSKQCAGGKCVNPSFCTQPGDVCANDPDCCSGRCANNRCAIASTCKPMGTLCTGVGCDQTCCSLSCGPSGTTGVNVCQQPSGCAPQEELCAASSDCCGGPGRITGQKSGTTTANDPLQCVFSDGGTLGRCETQLCLRPGAVCKASGLTCGGVTSFCCAGVLPDGGPVPIGLDGLCALDALGIPRCRAVDFQCTDAGVDAGSFCATSADCCGKPCIDDKCLASCVASGGVCTTTSDCCKPQECVRAPGSSKGTCGTTPASDGATCALYGQACIASTDCCNGVPCSNGTCRFN